MSSKQLISKPSITAATPPVDHSDAAVTYRTTVLGNLSVATVDMEVIGEGGAFIINDTDNSEVSVVQVAFERQNPCPLTLINGDHMVFEKSFRRLFLSWPAQVLNGKVSLLVFPAGVLRHAKIL